MSLDPKPDFEAIFESLPACYVVVTPDLTMVAATKAYYEATLTNPSMLTGHNLFDVFPEDPEHIQPDDGKRLTLSLQKVLRTKKTDIIPLQRYDLTVTDKDGDKLLERWWRQTQIPVFDAHQNIIYIINAVEDVTDMVHTLENAEDSIRNTKMN